MMNRGDGSGPRSKRLANRIGTGQYPIFTILQVCKLYRVSTNSIHPDNPLDPGHLPQIWRAWILTYVSKENLQDCIDILPGNSTTSEVTYDVTCSFILRK
jgi:hypothetical protein